MPERTSASIGARPCAHCGQDFTPKRVKARFCSPRCSQVGPLAPVIDHIVPLDAGGLHEPANVQCAHFLCNSKKGARVYGAGEQLRLVG